MAIDPAWIALIGTICGGVGLKFAEHWLGRSKVRVDDATQIRNELRTEVTGQREEIKQLEKEKDDLTDKYYALLEKHMALQTELAFALQKIRAETGQVAKVAQSIAEAPPDTTIEP